MRRRSFLLAFALPLVACTSGPTKVAEKPLQSLGAMRVLVRKIEQAGAQPVSNGAVLKRGDKLVLAVDVVVERTEAIHLYVAQKDATGTFQLLLPEPGMAAPSILPDQEIELPSATTWIELDDKKGPESLYVVGSMKPLAETGVLSFLQTGVVEMTRDPPPEPLTSGNRGIRFQNRGEREAVRQGLFQTSGIAVVEFSYQHE